LRNNAANLVNMLLASPASRKLALLRVHKTGSKSFRDALKHSFSPPERSPLEYSTTVTSEGLTGKSFISPHLSVAQWQALDDTSSWVVAVTMREPRARLRSAFRYFKSKRHSNPVQVGELLRDMDYGDFLASKHPVILGLKDNILTRFIGGGAFGMETETRNQIYLPEGLSLEKAESAAIAAINSGHVYPLVLEKPKDSLHLLCPTLGMPGIPVLGWQNRTAGGPLITLSPQITELEEAFIVHDVCVYAEAIKRLG
jgi:hypothetical protein